MDFLSGIKEAKIYNGENSVSFTSDARKTGQKNETRTLLNTIHKNKLKVDYKPKCKTKNYKILKGKHRQSTL